MMVGIMGDATNYVPMPHDEHQKSGGGVHKW